MFQDIITKYTMVILSYELITMDIVKAKLIDMFLDKVIYIMILLFISVFGILFNNSCCSKYSEEEKHILKLIKAGDKMDKLNGSGVQYYRHAREKINTSLPFVDIDSNILSKMEEIERSNVNLCNGGSTKKRKKRAD